MVATGRPPAHKSHWNNPPGHSLLEHQLVDIVAWLSFPFPYLLLFVLFFLFVSYSLYLCSAGCCTNPRLIYTVDVFNHQPNCGSHRST